MTSKKITFLIFSVVFFFCQIFFLKVFAQNDSLFKKAEQSFKNQEYALAVDYLAKYLLKNKKDAKAYFLKGLAEFKIQNPLGALKCFDSAVIHKKDYLEAIYNRASILQGLGRNDDAIRDYNNLVKKNPNIPIVRQERGKVFYALQKIDSARSDFLYALRLKSDMWESALFLGKIYWKRKEYQKSIICLDTTLKYKPKYEDAFFVKAQVYEEMQKIKEALGEYDKIFEVSPYAYQAYFGRAKLFYNQKNYKDALPDLLKITSKKPENSDYWLLLGKNYLALKEKIKACEAFSFAENLQNEEAKKLRKENKCE